MNISGEINQKQMLLKRARDLGDSGSAAAVRNQKIILLPPNTTTPLFLLCETYKEQTKVDSR